MRILEELWYGNIDPTKFVSSPCKDYNSVLDLIAKNEKELIDTMTDEQKELFSRYTDCVHELRAMTDISLFQNSFKMGAKVMLEVMEE